MEQLLTIPEVGQRLRMSRSAIYELLARGELRAIAVSGTRTRRVREADLDEYIRRQAEDNDPALAS